MCVVGAETATCTFGLGSSTHVMAMLFTPTWEFSQSKAALVLSFTAFLLVILYFRGKGKYKHS